MLRGAFTNGTGTGVGKARIGAAYAHRLIGRGLVLRLRKLVESGRAEGPEGLVSQQGKRCR
jgi:dethiobiotin synthetase